MTLVLFLKKKKGKQDALAESHLAKLIHEMFLVEAARGEALLVQAGMGIAILENSTEAFSSPAEAPPSFCLTG